MEVIFNRWPTIARRAHGHASTLAASLGNQSTDHNGVKDEKLHGPVNVVHSPLCDSTAAQIWKELEGLLTKSSDSMKPLLKLACGLKEEHPMMAPFPKESSLKDFISRCESVFKEKDSNFKKESTCSPGASGDDNDADVAGDHSEISPFQNKVQTLST